MKFLGKGGFFSHKLCQCKYVVERYKVVAFFKIHRAPTHSKELLLFKRTNIMGQGNYLMVKKKKFLTQSNVIYISKIL